MRSTQIDMFGASSDVPQIHQDRLEPRVWIRRLVIWHEPQTEPVRDITFKKGLNIIWTPDEGDVATDTTTPGVHLGHGAGKTMLCRLIRYCMCEEGFRGSRVQKRIKEFFPHAFVAAELEVDGEQWAVIRPLGESLADYVARGIAIEDLWQAGPSSNGVEPLLNAIRDAVLKKVETRRIPGRDKPLDWSHTLAWLTRDQECRFHGVLAWRGTSLEAKSPVLHNYSHEAKANITRALLGMITADEAELYAQHATLLQQKSSKEARLKSIEFVSQRQLSELAEEHKLRVASIPNGPLLVRQLREIANERLQQVSESTTLREIEARRQTLLREQDQLSQRLSEAADLIGREAQSAEIKRQQRQESRQDLEKFEVLISEILSALSEENEDQRRVQQALEERRARFQSKIDVLTDQIKVHRGVAQETEEKRDRFEAAYRDAREEGQELLRELERERITLRDAHYRARRLQDECVRLERTSTEVERLRLDLDGLNEDLKTSQQSLQDRRDQHRIKRQRFERLFDFIVRHLVGETASGTVRIDGRGVDVSLELGGRRVSAALESLKVVAFDLAALLAAMEGTAHLPGFLLHDSPREADLGASLYGRIFMFIEELARLTPEPAFQYIITTTTAPPEGLRDEQVVVRMRGTPTSERLLRVDL